MTDPRQSIVLAAEPHRPPLASLQPSLAALLHERSSEGSLHPSPTSDDLQSILLLEERGEMVVREGLSVGELRVI
jgi:hypothetical protein